MGWAQLGSSSTISLAGTCVAGSVRRSAGAGLSWDAEIARPPCFPYNLRPSLSTWLFHKIFPRAAELLQAQTLKLTGLKADAQNWHGITSSVVCWLKHIIEPAQIQRKGLSRVWCIEGHHFNRILLRFCFCQPLQ